MVPNVDGGVSDCQGDGPLRLGLDMTLSVCGVCVVVFGFYDVLLALTRVNGDGPDLLLDVLLDVMRPYELRGRFDI